MGVIVKKPGLLTTVQDLGRTGYQRDGIMVSGVMDTLSMKLANILIGNKETEAVLEITLIGPTLIFSVNTLISICGGNFSPTINGIPVAMYKPLIVQKGDTLEFGTVQQGSRCYIAFKGGIPVQKVLGSKSTCIPAKFGGFNGRPLLKNDLLPIKDFSISPNRKLNWRISSNFSQLLFKEEPIRFIKGRQHALFTEESIKTFKTKSFILTKDSNRMGFRLQGPDLTLRKQQEMITEGVAFGSVQVPANGQPIILMADRQTTGGYPKIAQVIQADLPRLAQLNIGDSISFSEVTLVEAQQLALQQHYEIQVLKKIILAKWKESEL
ncbi:biotin-dependent carboxyltransferase family protein [Neobacillus sp. D3-1R]|uniref:5-oxoprolinase subunit C family protein n=1 Tax=Neobacillus sp. D3-1R TaxID=3445778 RepID=UPI003FA15E66